MILDDAFLQQSDIAVAIKEALDDVMKTYGYAIDQALVTDIEPDEKVKSAMNEINAAQREQVAAQARGEAEKILKVKQAEAEAESKALQGQGIANQRKAIIEGLKLSVESFAAAVEGTTAKHHLCVALSRQRGRTVPPDARRSHDRTNRRRSSKINDLRTKNDYLRTGFRKKKNGGRCYKNGKGRDIGYALAASSCEGA